MKLFQKIAFLILISGFAFGAYAQTDTIKTGNIEIVKEYTPFVEEGVKQSFQPVMPQLVPIDRGNLSYAMPSAFIETQYQPDDLQPLPYAGESARFVRTAYVKAGYGTSKNPLVQFALNGMQDNNYTIGARGGFQAIEGDLNEQKMHDANLEVFGTKELTNATLNASVGYDRNANWLYGYVQDIPVGNPTEFDSDKTFNVVQANIGVESANTDPYALRHNTQANFSLLNENLDELNETQIGFETTISKRIFEGLDAQLAADITTRTSKHDDHVVEAYQKQTETLLNLTPSFKPKVEGINAEVGASINNDEENEVKIFPHITVDIPLNNDQFTVFAGWTGRTMMNGYTQIQAVNPRISSDSFTKNYTKEIRTPIGIRGTLSDQFTFTASISQEVSKNAPLWVNNSTLVNGFDRRTFLTVYEDKLTNWRPNATANYQFGEKVSVLGDFSYNIYSTEVSEEAWQLPEFDGKLSVNVKPIDQLSINGDLQVLTGIDFTNVGRNDSGVLNSGVNANLGAQFDVNDKFAIFIDANNLANSDVEIWKNYPAVGTNILAGIVFSLD